MPVKDVLKQISERASNPETAELILLLGDAIDQRLRRQNESVATTVGNIEHTLSGEILELRADIKTVTQLIRDHHIRTGKHTTERLDAMQDKLHTLANHFMMLEAKLNDIVELLTSNDNGS